MNLFDHLLFVVLAIVLPLEGLITFRRMVAAVRAGQPDAKRRMYRRTLIMEWTIGAVLLTSWYVDGRSWPALGIGLGSVAGGVAGAISVAIGLAFVRLQHRTIARLTAERLDRLRATMGEIAQLLPSTPAELRWFSATAITAGICEELLYRGFMIWYLTPLAGLAGAVAIGSICFGFAHAYQGRKGIIKTAIVGAVMAGFYLVSGTLWAPMIVHAAVDLSAGAIGRRVGSDSGR